ncbi:MAG TPA: alpha/beta fold hydrolase [Candidatus Stackebrandtia excrementipullorum]|nr:alpha/beta fold hydrolase [Candidatus Stackebrandtia excrementipullorum]
MTQSALVYIAGAGGDAAAFRQWTSMLPGIEIRTPSRPGKASRWDEAPLDTVEAMAEDVLGQIAEWDDRPLVIVGFSLGALVGYEVALRLASTGGDVHALVVAGSRAPHDAEYSLSAEGLDDAALREMISGLSPETRVAMSDDDLAELMLPGIRADLQAAAGYRREIPQEGTLDIPITAMAADRDEVSPPEICRPWHLYTTGIFDFVTVGGGHTFLDKPKESVARPLRRLFAAISGGRDDVPTADATATRGRPNGAGAHDEVRAVWETVLGRTDFGDDVDFFSVGGSSLLAARVIATVRKKTTVKVPLRRFLAAPTVTGLTNLVTEAQEQA